MLIADSAIDEVLNTPAGEFAFKMTNVSYVPVVVILANAKAINLVRVALLSACDAFPAEASKYRAVYHQWTVLGLRIDPENVAWASDDASSETGTNG
jgi:hypothetical protein